MADIISTDAPMTTRRSELPRFPWRAIVASVTAMPSAIGKAFAMVYADPYANLHRHEQIVPDEDLEGRDPNW